MATNINNLNILTFIKDIYQSLKHIDTCFNSYKENIDARLTRIEDNQNTILDKLNNVEQMLFKINLTTQQQVSLDKNIEHELLEKMNNLNKTSILDKLQLKPEELTFANILENNYSIQDINNTLNIHNPPNINNREPLPIDATDSLDNSLILLPTFNNNISNNISNSIQSQNETKNKETLENLLF